MKRAGCEDGKPAGIMLSSSNSMGLSIRRGLKRACATIFTAEIAERNTGIV
jgi:hypothetical protein